MGTELVMLSLGNHLLGITLQQAKLDQTLNQNQGGGFMGQIEMIARTTGLDGRAVRCQNDIVNIALGRAKTAAYRVGAGNIRRVILQLAARINQHQLLLQQNRFVFNIVQGTGVFAGGDNARVGLRLGSLKAVAVVQLCLDIRLCQAGKNQIQCPVLSSNTDLCRLGHQLQLLGVFNQPLLVQQMTQGHDFPHLWLVGRALFR